VSGIGNQYLAARRIAASVVIGADHGHAGELPLRTGHGRQRHAAHAGDILEYFLQFIEAGQITLAQHRGAQRVAVTQAR
jgi:hypothetical protein